MNKSSSDGDPYLKSILRCNTLADWFIDLFSLLCVRHSVMMFPVGIDDESDNNITMTELWSCCCCCCGCCCCCFYVVIINLKVENVTFYGFRSGEQSIISYNQFSPKISSIKKRKMRVNDKKNDFFIAVTRSIQ